MSDRPWETPYAKWLNAVAAEAIRIASEREKTSPGTDPAEVAGFVRTMVAILAALQKVPMPDPEKWNGK